MGFEQPLESFEYDHAYLFNDGEDPRMVDEFLFKHPERYGSIDRIDFLSSFRGFSRGERGYEKRYADRSMTLTLDKKGVRTMYVERKGNDNDEIRTFTNMEEFLIYLSRYNAGRGAMHG